MICVIPRGNRVSGSIEAGIVEDLALAIEKYGDDREALRDPSVQLRYLALTYLPLPERVAMTEIEVLLVDVIERRQAAIG